MCLHVSYPPQAGLSDNAHRQRNPEHRVIAPALRHSPRQLTGDDPADAGSIGIEGGGRARLPRHQVLEIEHADPGEDPLYIIADPRHAAGQAG